MEGKGGGIKETSRVNISFWRSEVEEEFRRGKEEGVGGMFKVNRLRKSKNENIHHFFFFNLLI